MTRRLFSLSLILLAACSSAPVAEAPPKGIFRLRARRQAEEKIIDWKAKETALIICDMWNDHTCKGAARRVAAMAPKVNAFAEMVRRQGGLVIHAPSGTMNFYKGTVGRELATNAPMFKAPMKFKWRKLIPEKEVKLPVDDKDWCDCRPKCDIEGRRGDKSKNKAWPWTRQIATIEIKEGDAITDNGQEVWNLMEERGMKNVLMTGVHTNMCVLGRPFGIRQMTMVGRNIVIVRDLTDCLYDPAKEPQVSHDRGTELIVEHIEKFWCPSIGSEDILKMP